jgi:predicted P-loop ATPase
VLPQLYAEAIHLYRAGEKLYIENEEANAIAETIRYDRFRNDELEETIIEWLDNIPKDLQHVVSPKKLQVNDIIIHCLKEAPTKSRGLANRIGNILRRVGYTSQTYRENGRVKYGFVKS